MPLPSRPSLLKVGLCSIGLVGALGVAGCGGDTKKASSSSSTSSSAPSGSTSGAASTVSGGPAGTTADAATTAAVTASYVTFFDGTASTDARRAALQGGDVIAASLGDAINSPVLKLTSATVAKVTLASPDHAKVTYTLSLSGNPIIKDTVGDSVRVNGNWKVAAVTFCALLAAQAAAPAACSVPSVVALPTP